MSTTTEENSPGRMTFDSSRAVISTSRALRLSFPKPQNKAILYDKDTKAVRVEFARTEAHAKQMGGEFRPARPTAKELRGSYGRPKPYTLSKKLSGKAAATEAKPAKGKKA